MLDLRQDAVWQRLAQTLDTTIRRLGPNAPLGEIERFLLRQASPDDTDLALVRMAVERLYATQGRVRVRELAARGGLSPRQFERRFKRATGVTPKALARIIRFEAVRDALLRPPQRTPIALARDFGYADQAHLIRDFKALAGLTPGTFVNAAIRRHELLLRQMRPVPTSFLRTDWLCVTLRKGDWMAEEDTERGAGTLPWRGIHHLALATPDIDATRRFYNEVLGLPVSEVFPSREGRGRHALVFVKPGDSETWGLHFFERPVASPDPARGGEALLHIALSLPDRATAEGLHRRLRDVGIEPTVLAELGGNLFFSDLHGVMLEVTWPKD